MNTLGEKAFEEYLTEQGLSYEFEKVQSGKQKRPDFTLHLDVDHFFDVKDCQTDNMSGGYLDPYRWLREQIEQGRRKFKEFKGSPCAIVMFAAGGSDFILREPDFALGAMYGDFAIAVPVDTRSGSPSASEMTFLGGGKMIRPGWSTPQNTTLSALITLRRVPIGQARLSDYVKRVEPDAQLWPGSDLLKRLDFDITETRLGVMVWENAFATTPLTRDLFNGPFDERWGRHGDVVKRVYLGDGLREYYRVRSSG